MSLLQTSQQNLLGSRLGTLGIAKVHALEDGAVQHHSESAVSAHDHPSAELSVGVLLRVDLECADAALLPLFLREVEQLGLACEKVLLLFLAGLDCDMVSVKVILAEGR